MSWSISRLFGRSNTVRRTRRRPPARLKLEELEARIVPSVLNVTNSNDSGLGSLRQAILTANAATTVDTINFPGVSGTINLFSPLPTITKPVVIDTGLQPPTLTINGALAGGNGLTIAASGVTIRGLIFTNFAGSGIFIKGSNVKVQDCYLGLTSVGNPAGNGLDGVTIAAGSTGDHIGGPGEGNTISGNLRYGVGILGGSSNFVQNNLIGTDPNGMLTVGNLGGVALLNGASANNINTNVISGNTVDGVLLLGSTVTGNLVQGNEIGTNASGTSPLPNGNGVLLAAGAHGNTIGGSFLANGNTISGNTRYGIKVDGPGTAPNTIQNNVIGLNRTGNAAVANNIGVAFYNGVKNASLTGNTISGNTDGVDIADPGTSGITISKNMIGTDPSGSTPLGNVNVGVFIRNGAAMNLLSGNVISANGGEGVVIDDSSSSKNTLTGNLIGTNAAGTVGLGSQFFGIFVAGTNTRIGGTTTTARNVISGNSTSGILVLGTGTSIQGNYIGLNSMGTAAIPNNLGIEVQSASSTTIGGTLAGARNVISGNTSDGIYVSSSSATTIQGNYIGTSANGVGSVANGLDGILVSSSANGTIGGATLAARNVISGNGSATTGAGIEITDSTSSGWKIQGNIIGADAGGKTPLANGLYGIAVHNGAQNILIGGTSPGDANIIAFNGVGGVLVGADATHGYGGAAGTGVTIRENSIFLNGGNGGIFDSAPIVNAPTLDLAVVLTGQGTYLSGSLSAPSGLYMIDLYTDPVASAGVYEGKTFLGTILVPVGLTASADFSTILPTTLVPGQVITATVTDASGDTSIFSLPVRVV
jgi:titin